MSFAIILAVVIYTLGRVSGAHLNPAVTIALLVTKRFPPEILSGNHCPGYRGIDRQPALFPDCWHGCGDDRGAGSHDAVSRDRYGQAILAEAIGTFVLMLAIMGVAVDERAPPGFAGLVIGLTLGGMITVTGNIAGASLNPARTFGPFLMDMLLGGSNLWAFFPIYIIGPVIGAVLAAVFYDQVTAD